MFVDFWEMAADCELQRKRNKEQQRKILTHLFNPKVKLQRIVFPTDVQQTALLEDDAPEGWRSNVDQQDPDLLQIKEKEDNLCTCLVEEQLNGEEEENNAATRFTTVHGRNLNNDGVSSSVGTKDSTGKEKHLFIRLHRLQLENRGFQVSRSDKMEAEAGEEDCRGAETNKNPYLNTLIHFICSDTEDSEDYDERLYPDFQLKLSDTEPQSEENEGNNPNSQQKIPSNTGPQSEGGDEDWKERRAPESDVHQMLLSKDVPDMEQRDQELPSIKKKKAKLKKACSFFSVTLKSNDVEKTRLLSQLHQHKMTNGGFRCRGAELSRIPGLKSQEDYFSSSECEDGEDVEMDSDESKSILLSDTGPKARDGDKDLKESRASESGVNGFRNNSSQCEKQHLNRRNFYKHRKGHPGINSGCSVKKKIDGDSHSKVQKTLKLNGCGESGKSYRSKAHLKEQIHTGRRPFCCDNCGRRFTQHAGLYVHTRVHVGEKACGCDVCGLKYKDGPTLTSHMKTHRREKTYFCDVCKKKTFKHKSKLNNHKRGHRKPKV